MKKFIITSLAILITSHAFAKTQLDYTIKPSTLSDLNNLVSLAMQRHYQYQHFNPHFWHVAQHAKQLQKGHFKSLLEQKSTVSFIAYNTQRQAIGMIISTPFHEPPVYSPGTKSYIIDDYYVVKKQYWPTLGKALLSKVVTKLHHKNVHQIIIITANKDKAKYNMISRNTHFLPLSTWFVSNQ